MYRVAVAVALTAVSARLPRDDDLRVEVEHCRRQALSASGTQTEIRHLMKMRAFGVERNFRISGGGRGGRGRDEYICFEL